MFSKLSLIPASDNSLSIIFFASSSERFDKTGTFRTLRVEFLIDDEIFTVFVLLVSSIFSNLSFIFLLDDVLLGDVLLGDVFLGDVLLSDVLLGDVLLGDVLLGDVLLGDVFLGDVLLDVIFLDNVLLGVIFFGDIFLGDIFFILDLERFDNTGFFETLLLLKFIVGDDAFTLFGLKIELFTDFCELFLVFTNVPVLI
jgi:hypothetical protein